MKIRQFLILTSIVTGVTAGSAVAQTSTPQPTDTPAANSNTANTTATDTAMNPGTAAESANTTALTTSSYHQGNGLFSLSWFGNKK